MINEKDNNEINKISQQIEHLNNNFNKLGDSFHRIADITEKMAENCIQKFLKRRFFMQPSFWTAFIAVSGLLGLLLTWQQQVKATEVSNIQKQIAAIKYFKLEENRAMSKSRVLIINQTINCPIKKIPLLEKFQQDRNNSLVDVISYNSGIDGSNGGKAVWLIVKLFVGKVYNLNANEICKINPKKFDHELMSLQIQMNKVIEKKITEKEEELKSIESRILFF